MRFGEAIDLCIYEGEKITNRNWNGKGMWLYYTPGHYVDIKDWDGETTDSERLKGAVMVGGHIDMYNARGERIIGWLASQMDMVSDAWEIVPEPKDIEGIKRLLDEIGE